MSEPEPSNEIRLAVGAALTVLCLVASAALGMWAFSTWRATDRDDRKFEFCEQAQWQSRACAAPSEPISFGD